MQLDGSASLPFFSGFSTVKLYMWVVAVFIVEMPPLWRRIVRIDLYTKEFVGSVLVFVEVRLDWDTQKVLVLCLHLNFSSDVGCNCWVERTGSSFHLKSTSRGSLGWGGLQVLCLCEVLICRSLGQPLFTVLLPQPFFSPSPPLIPLFTAVLYRTCFFPGLSDSSATEWFFSLDIPAPHTIVMCISYYLNNKSFCCLYLCHSELLSCSSNDFVSASWDM